MNCKSATVNLQEHSPSTSRAIVLESQSLEQRACKNAPHFGSSPATVCDVPRGIRSTLGVRRAGLDDGAAVHTPIAIAPELLYLPRSWPQRCRGKASGRRRDASNFSVGGIYPVLTSVGGGDGKTAGSMLTARCAARLTCCNQFRHR
jgi:hypothetical protein